MNVLVGLRQNTSQAEINVNIEAPECVLFLSQPRQPKTISLMDLQGNLLVKHCSTTTTAHSLKTVYPMAQEFQVSLGQMVRTLKLASPRSKVPLSDCLDFGLLSWT